MKVKHYPLLEAAICSTESACETLAFLSKEDDADLSEELRGELDEHVETLSTVNSALRRIFEDT